MEGREGSEGQSHKEEKREGGSKMWQGLLAKERGLYLDKCKKLKSLKQCLTATRPTSHN